MQSKTLEVTSRSASFRFAEQGQDPATIGETLGVAYYLEGSIRQQDAGVRITAQLIRRDDGFHVWSKSYERKLIDGFEMQKAVAANIAYVSRSRLVMDILRNEGWKQDPRFAGIEPDAVQYFLAALEERENLFLGEGGDWDSYLQFIKSSVASDPNFHHGYVTLANYYVQSHHRGRLSLLEARPAAHQAISKAKELESVSPLTGDQIGRAQFQSGADSAGNGLRLLPCRGRV